MSTTFFHCSNVSSSRFDAGRADAGVVEEDVEAAEGFAYAREQRADRRGVRDIGGDGERGALRGARFGDRLLERLAAPTGEGDAIAFVQQRDGRGLADAGAGAGDDGDFRGSAHERVLDGVRGAYCRREGPAEANPSTTGGGRRSPKWLHRGRRTSWDASSAPSAAGRRIAAPAAPSPRIRSFARRRRRSLHSQRGFPCIPDPALSDC